VEDFSCNLRVALKKTDFHAKDYSKAFWVCTSNINKVNELM